MQRTTPRRAGWARPASGDDLDRRVAQLGASAVACWSLPPRQRQTSRVPTRANSSAASTASPCVAHAARDARHASSFTWRVCRNPTRRAQVRTLAQQHAGAFQAACAPFQCALRARAGAEPLPRQRAWPVSWPRAPQCSTACGAILAWLPSCRS